MIVVPGNGRIEPKKANRILLVQLGFIGDVVVTIPVIRAVRETFPESMLAVSVREHSRELVEDVPWVDAVISVDKRKRPWYSTIAHQWGFYRRLRSYRFDLSINVRTGTRGALMSFLSGARCRVGHYSYRHTWTNRLYTHVVQPEAWDGIYAGEQNLNVVAPLHLDIPTRVPELHLSPQRARRVAKLLGALGVPEDKPLIALHPFSSRETKNWAPARFAELAGRIVGAYDVAVIITGSAADRLQALKIAEKCAGKVFVLAGMVSIGELACVLKRSTLLVGVDTGAIHIAAAVGTPTITLFGPSDPTVWKPPGASHEIVSAELPCAPCRRAVCDSPDKGSCLSNLSVEKVWSVVERRVGEFLSAHRLPVEAKGLYTTGASEASSEPS